MYQRKPSRDGERARNGTGIQYHGDTLYTPEQVAAYPAVLRPPSQEEQGQRGLRYGSTALPRREEAGRGGGYDVSKGDGHIRHRRRDGNKSCAASVPLGRRERFHSPEQLPSLARGQSSIRRTAAACSRCPTRIFSYEHGPVKALSCQWKACECLHLPAPAWVLVGGGGRRTSSPAGVSHPTCLYCLQYSHQDACVVP